MAIISGTRYSATANQGVHLAQGYLETPNVSDEERKLCSSPQKSKRPEGTQQTRPLSSFPSYSPEHSLAERLQFGSELGSTIVARSWSLTPMTDAPVSRIRNFSIIAHIDHGKSTLADRLLQVTGTVADREMKEQFLDSMELERERGITIKLQAARMNYTAADDQPYVLNLIDTPGHVDFSYEVSRSLAACEGALLVVDASQGVEAQTLANVYLAIENDLEIIPVLNKIDLPGAEPERVKQEIEEIVGLDCSGAILASAKAGIGVDQILESIVHLVPPPEDTTQKPLRALIFDSYYDLYRGVVVYFRVMDGTVKVGDRIRLMASGKEYDIDELGVLSPTQMPVQELHAGEVGYIFCSD